jgi:uncharacterized ferritin-like protein (DUF455 family)
VTRLDHFRAAALTGLLASAPDDAQWEDVVQDALLVADMMEKESASLDASRDARDRAICAAAVERRSSSDVPARPTKAEVAPMPDRPPNRMMGSDGAIS